MRTAMPRTLISAAACSALLLTASACSSDEPAPKPGQTASSATPSPTKSAWESKFDQKQKQQYEAALSRFTEYERTAVPIWAEGKATPAAEKVFADYWTLPIIPMTQLRQVEKFESKIIGTAKVLWSEPTTVKIGTSATNVTFKQCVDPSTIKVEYAPGAKVEEKHQGPYVRTVSLDKVGAKPFLIREIVDITSGKKMPPCGP